MAINEHKESVSYDASVSNKIKNLVKSLELDKIKEEFENNLMLTEGIHKQDNLDKRMFAIKEKLNFDFKVIRLKIETFLLNEKKSINENFPINKKKMNKRLDNEIEALNMNLNKEFNKLLSDAEEKFAFGKYNIYCDEKIKNFFDLTRGIVHNIEKEQKDKIVHIEEKIQNLVKKRKQKETTNIAKYKEIENELDLLLLIFQTKYDYELSYGLSKTMNENLDTLLSDHKDATDTLLKENFESPEEYIFKFKKHREDFLKILHSYLDSKYREWETKISTLQNELSINLGEIYNIKASKNKIDESPIIRESSFDKTVFLILTVIVLLILAIFYNKEYLLAKVQIYNN
jgi:hypothetical protein